MRHPCAALQISRFNRQRIRDPAASTFLQVRQQTLQGIESAFVVADQLLDLHRIILGVALCRKDQSRGNLQMFSDLFRICL